MIYIYTYIYIFKRKQGWLYPTPNLQTNSRLDLGLQKEDQTKHNKGNQFQTFKTNVYPSWKCKLLN